MNKISVPYKVNNVFQGFAETHGILYLEGEELMIEFQTKDNVVGAIKSDIKNIKVAVADIEEVDFKKSLLGNTLTIRLSKLNVSTQIPKQESGEIKVSVERKNIEAALDFVSSVKLEVAD